MTGTGLLRGRGRAALVGAASMLARRPESGLPRLRWLLGLFAAGTCGALAVVAVTLGRPLPAAAALALVVLRYLDMRRGRLGHVLLDPVEALLLVAVLAGMGIDASSPVAYTALYFRAAYAGRRRLVGSVVLSVAALEFGAALSMSAPFARAAQTSWACCSPASSCGWSSGRCWAASARSSPSARCWTPCWRAWTSRSSRATPRGAPCT